MPDPYEYGLSATQRSAIAGATAGLVSRFVIAPLDVLKIRLQLQACQSLQDPQQDILDRPGKRSVSRQNCQHAGRAEGYDAGNDRTRRAAEHIRGARAQNRNLPTPALCVRGMVKEIWKLEGIQGFWKGNVPAEALYIFYGTVQFSSYRFATGLIQNAGLAGSVEGLRQSTGWEAMAAGAFAGAMATTVTYPLDLLRTRFAAQGAGPDRIYRTLRSGVGDIYRSEGATGFFKGIGAGVGSVVPYMGLFFAGYEVLHPLLKRGLVSLRHRDSLTSSFWASEHALAGVLAGICAKTGVFPLDLIRKRLQVQGPMRERYFNGRVPLYSKGVWNTARQIVRAEGWTGLYRGLTVSLIKSAPASAVTMWTYELTLRMLGPSDI